MANGKLSDEILIFHLEENLVDDPYGTAVYSIRNILFRAMAYSNAMSNEEYEILKELDEALARRTNEPPTVHG
jgi:hypothetical protein